MRNEARNLRADGRRRGNSRRIKSVILLFYFIVFMALFMIALHIRIIYAQLTDMQNTLKRIEVLQYGTNIYNGSDFEEIDYVSSVGVVNVGKPVQRTSSQILERLSELGQNNPGIEIIYNNYSQYPKNLLAALANNPEMADFAVGYTNGEKIAAGELTSLEKKQDCPLFLQWDPRWGYQPYGTDNIGLAGCGPTCMSMVLFYLTRDEKLTPDRIAAYSMENGYYVEGTGTAWALMEDISNLYNINVTKPRMSERAMKSVLDNGGIIICAMGEGDFTVSGHFIVIYGYDAKGFKVNDPNCVARSSKRWTFDELEPQVKNIWGYEKKW